ncbi:hypothetical protein [Caldimonas brevitalea]|uniref:Uncharacterized protein n=1 Tax=Caldimonas brevitalea TaxID=413882 RepID=A0A0G3BLB1_9BURK|nr:hypothetical protein [Caldimonas brevitalea]AKJ30202.1 hypothetical protein AAW51_3511 [Caldimonas brevitalea]
MLTMMTMKTRSMQPSRRTAAAGLLLALTLAAGCGGDPHRGDGDGGSNGGSNGGGDNGSLPDRVSTAAEFLAYVQQVIARFSADTEPLDVDRLGAPTADRDEAADV